MDDFPNVGEISERIKTITEEIYGRFSKGTLKDFFGEFFIGPLEELLKKMQYFPNLCKKPTGRVPKEFPEKCLKTPLEKFRMGSLENLKNS